MKKRQNKEYDLCKAIALYLKLQYPKVLFHWDLSGLNHSKAQAGMNKAIQHSKGWPDLFIAEPAGNYSGLFLELKAEGFDIYSKRKKDFYGMPCLVNDHIINQNEMLSMLRVRGYYADFACGFDQAKQVIDSYLRTNGNNGHKCNL